MGDLRGKDRPAGDSGGGRPKIMAAIVVLIAMGAIGAYGYETGLWNAPPAKPNSVVSDNSLPTTAPVR